jgi:hypothetical protein
MAIEEEEKRRRRVPDSNAGLIRVSRKAPREQPRLAVGSKTTRPLSETPLLPGSRTTKLFSSSKMRGERAFLADAREGPLEGKSRERLDGER